MSGHGYRYTGKGERFKGVPPRDITQDAFDALSPLEQRTVLESGAYEAMTATQAKKAEKESAPARTTDQAEGGE